MSGYIGGAGTAPFVPKGAAPEFLPTAPEFVPGIGRISSGDPLNADAAEPAELVPVVQDGVMYFVNGDEDGGGAALEPFDWTFGKAAIPVTGEFRTVADLAGPPALQEFYRSRTLESLAQVDPDDERLKEVPPEFHSLWPLDAPGRDARAAGAFGHPSSLYKVLSAADGRAYVCRRFDTVRPPAKVAAAAQRVWSGIRHACIVTLKEVQVKASGVFFLHAFHPGARTLRAQIENVRGGAQEAVVWSFLCQMAAALRAAHLGGAAIRCLDATHVIVTPDSRFRVAGCGIYDVIEFEAAARKGLADLQAVDMANLGKLSLSFAVGVVLADDVAAIRQGIEILRHRCSSQLCRCIEALISRPVSLTELASLLGDALLAEVGACENACDALDEHLSREFENGRLLRLLLMFGAINERPDQDVDVQWSESGDRYILKLFRDYVFHQVDESQRPAVDFGHMLHALNKLDAGDQEEMLLSTRDSRHLIVASFADVRGKLEAAFADLYRAAAPVPEPVAATPGYRAHGTRGPLLPMAPMGAGPGHRPGAIPVGGAMGMTHGMMGGSLGAQQGVGGGFPGGGYPGGGFQGGAGQAGGGYGGATFYPNPGSEWR